MRRGKESAGAGGDLVPIQIYDYSIMESQLSIINSDPLLRRVVIKGATRHPATNRYTAKRE